MSQRERKTLAELRDWYGENFTDFRGGFCSDESDTPRVVECDGEEDEIWFHVGEDLGEASIFEKGRFP